MHTIVPKLLTTIVRNHISVQNKKHRLANCCQLLKKTSMMQQSGGDMFSRCDTIPITEESQTFGSARRNCYINIANAR